MYNFQEYVQAVTPDTDNWIFFSGQDFNNQDADAFLNAVSFIPGANPVIVGHIFPVDTVEEQLVSRMDPPNQYKPWAYISYQYAVMAKGDVHVFIPRGRDILHTYATGEGTPRVSNWERYELPILTRSGGAVNRILRYDSDGSLETATVVWKRGDPVIGGQLGVEWDFVTPPWVSMRGGDSSSSSFALWNLLCCNGSCCF
jgi:hypothetical protein